MAKAQGGMETQSPEGLDLPVAADSYPKSGRGGRDTKQQAWTLTIYLGQCKNEGVPLLLIIIPGPCEILQEMGVEKPTLLR